MPSLLKSLFLAACALCVCSPAGAAEKLVVASSIFPVHDWVRVIGGDAVDAHLVLPSGASPHVFEPTPRDMVHFARADVFLYIGAGLESWAAQMLSGAGKKSLTAVALGELESRERIDPGNPHVWLDPVYARDMVAHIARVLGDAAPEHRTDFRRRADAYAEHLDALDQRLRGLPRRHVRAAVLQHNDFSLLFQRYNLPLGGVIHTSPDREPTAREFAQLIGRLRQDLAGKFPGVAVFTEPQIQPRLAETLVRELGGDVRVLTLDPLGGPEIEGRDSYLALMHFNREQLLTGLLP